MRYFKYCRVLLLGAVLLAGCSGDDEILPGERISIVPSDQTDILSVDAEAFAEGVNFPPSTSNRYFTAAGQNAGHQGGHYKIDYPLEKIFDVSVGTAADFGTELAQPVANAKGVFTVTPGGIVTASDINSGAILWQIDIDPSDDETQTNISGGLSLLEATDGGHDILFVHASKNDLFALNADTGAEIWRVSFNIFLSSAPTVSSNIVLVSDIDGRLFALLVANGELLWDRISGQETTGIIGSVAPAIFGNEVIFASGDGHVTALSLEQGQVLWSENLTPIERRTALEGITDIKAHPVHDGGLVFIVSHSRALYAFNSATGRPVWEKALSGIEMPWASGQSLFVTTIDGRIYSLRRQDGAVRWLTALPGAYDPNLLFSPNSILYTSAIAAEKKIILASNDGKLHILDGMTGEIEEVISLGSPATASPIIANNTIYTLTLNGRLKAYR